MDGTLRVNREILLKLVVTAMEDVGHRNAAINVHYLKACLLRCFEARLDSLSASELAPPLQTSLLEEPEDKVLVLMGQEAICHFTMAIVMKEGKVINHRRIGCASPGYTYRPATG